METQHAEMAAVHLMLGNKCSLHYSRLPRSRLSCQTGCSCCIASLPCAGLRLCSFRQRLSLKLLHCRAGSGHKLALLGDLSLQPQMTRCQPLTVSRWL